MTGRGRKRAWVIAALVAGAGWWSGAQAAMAGSSSGVSIPDETFAQNSGVHTITVTIGSAAVGRQFSMEFHTNLSPVPGDEISFVSISGSTGGSCSGSAGDYWCQPGSSGWQQGAVEFHIGTKTATCSAGAGVQCLAIPLTVVLHGDQLQDVGSTSGSFVIKAPASSPAPTHKAGSPTVRVTHSSSASAKPSALPSPSASSSPTAASASADVPADAASASPSIPAHLDAADTASASSSSAGHTLEYLVPFVIVALVLLFAGWRFAGRRRRRDGDSGPDSGGDETGE